MMRKTPQFAIFEARVICVFYSIRDMKRDPHVSTIMPHKPGLCLKHHKVYLSKNRQNKIIYIVENTKENIMKYKNIGYIF